MATPLLYHSAYNQKKSSPVGNHFSTIKSPPSAPTGSPYLPSYLLGNSSPAPSGYGGLLSKNSPMTHSSNSRLLSRSPPQASSYMYAGSLDNRLNRFSPPHNSSSSSRKEKPGAPPTEGLYHSTNQLDDSAMGMELSVAKKLGSRFPVASPGDQVFSPNKHSSVGKENFQVFGTSRENAVQSPAQIDPFYSQGDSLSSSDTLDDTAVTVFGFPPAASSFILQQFSQCGTIECHEIHNTGNWLHIKYHTRIQAKKALSKNGKIFARSIMIGVCSCIKKDLAFLEEQENTGLNNTPSGTPGRPKIGTKRPNSTSIRSLASASSINSPVPGANFVGDSGTPQKKNSVVTKALDYVFGW